MPYSALHFVKVIFFENILCRYCLSSVDLSDLSIMRNPRYYSGLADLQPVIPGVTDRDLGNDIFQPDFVVPAQWSAAFRRRYRSREAALLGEVLVSAWQDLDSPKRRVRLEAKVFFEQADAGEPLSLRFLCEAFGLELSAVQQIARDRIRRAESQGRDSTLREDRVQPLFSRARNFAPHHSSV